MPDVLLSMTDGVAEVRLNRPERRNAFRGAMYDELLHAAARLREESSVRAIVLTGEGATFCAGMDTAGFDLMRADGKAAAWRPADADGAAAAIVDVDGLTLGRGQRAVLVWTTMEVPVIAAVHGAAVGMGLQLALGADIRIVAPDATLGAYEIRWRLAPDGGGTQLLSQLIGFRPSVGVVRLGAPGQRRRSGGDRTRHERSRRPAGGGAGAGSRDRRTQSRGDPQRCAVAADGPKRCRPGRAACRTRRDGSQHRQ